MTEIPPDTATDAATFDWHGLAITIAPAGHEGSNSNVSTHGYRNGGTYQTATGIEYRNLYAMLAGYQDLSIAEAELFGKALEELRRIEDRHNPAPTIEPGPGLPPPPPGAIVGTLDSKYHVRLSKHESTGNTVVELETGSHGWLQRVIDVPWEDTADGTGKANKPIREAVAEMSLERGRK